MLAGIILLAIGFFGRDDTALVLGLVLGSLGGLELSVREHFAGYRSHTTLLAGAVFVFVVGAGLYLLHLVLAVCLAIGGAAFAATFLLLRRAFRRASGGYSFRVGRL